MSLQYLDFSRYFVQKNCLHDGDKKTFDLRHCCYSMASGFARGYRFVHHVKRGKRPFNDGKLVSLITANTFENFA